MLNVRTITTIDAPELAKMQLFKLCSLKLPCSPLLSPLSEALGYLKNKNRFATSTQESTLLVLLGGGSTQLGNYHVIYGRRIFTNDV